METRYPGRPERLSGWFSLNKSQCEIVLCFVVAFRGNELDCFW